MPILRQTVQVISKIFTPAKARQQRFCPGTQNCKIHRKIFCRAAARRSSSSSSAMGIAPIFRAGQARHTGLLLNQLDIPQPLVHLLLHHHPFVHHHLLVHHHLPIFKAGQMHHTEPLLSQLGTPRSSTFPFQQLSTVAKCSLDIFQFANTRNLTKSEMCLELLLNEKAK